MGEHRSSAEHSHSASITSMQVVYEVADEFMAQEPAKTFV
eukprot:CAMPEP_0194506104 /NCGR_PEP_ID=MMETSP0253-20130528/33793_1 /TAXON_ID=2966 /ORGANISM="Noctiluca scintillans" /LENGTH=39 /DNA_ID= /DNA_START= /DNA_END= /DNA_ORIENTATION=